MLKAGKEDLKLRIAETFVLPSNGKFILSCTEPRLDHLTDKYIVSMLFDKDLYLYVNNKFIRILHVSGVETSSSIVDKKNIYLLIDEDVSGMGDIKQGYLKLTKS